MSRKNLFLILFFLLVLVGLGAWVFLSKDSGGTPSEPTENPDLFPFGGTTPGSSGGTGSLGGSSSETPGTIDLSGGEAIPRLRKISDDQVSGAVIYTRNGDYVIRYMDRATGHAYEAKEGSSTKVKISNLTIPQIYETVWSEEGTRLLARYLKEGQTIQTFYGTLPATTTEGIIEGYFLPSNIREIAYENGRILYLEPGTDGRLIAADMDGAKKSVLANLYTDEWLIDWNGPDSALLVPKPSGTIAGDSHLLNVRTGAIRPLLGQIMGLTGTINPRGTYMLASSGGENTVESAVYGVADDSLSVLPIKTLAEKCAWSRVSEAVIYCAVPTVIPGGMYPDDWYQGLVSFSDKIWKMDLATGEVDVLLDPYFEAQENMDLVKLSLDEKDGHLIFTNKNDSSLWIYDLE